MLFLTIFIKFRIITTITQFPTVLPVLPVLSHSNQTINDEYFYHYINIRLEQSDTTRMALNFKQTFAYIVNLLYRQLFRPPFFINSHISQDRFGHFYARNFALLHALCIDLNFYFH